MNGTALPTWAAHYLVGRQLLASLKQLITLQANVLWTSLTFAGVANILISPQRHKDILIKPSDKDGTVVVWRADLYKAKALRQL